MSHSSRYAKRDSGRQPAHGARDFNSQVPPWSNVPSIGRALVHVKIKSPGSEHRDDGTAFSSRFHTVWKNDPARCMHLPVGNVASRQLTSGRAKLNFRFSIRVLFNPYNTPSQEWSVF